MKLENHLNSAEEKWLQPAYNFLREAFSKTPLPSHDHHHHLRVWQYARKLLIELEKQGVTSSYRLAEGLLLSCMFHDSGMLKDMGQDHGEASTLIFKEFLQQTKMKPVEPENILEAIKMHDDKSYFLARWLVKEKEVQLLPALQISDDLDAFGYAGVYRYSEIYLLRGIPLEDMGLKIMANLAGRYGNFMSNCARLPGMIKIHSPRQQTIERFFRGYNLQIHQREENGEEPDTGPIAVVKHIYRQVMMNTPTISDVCNNVLESSEDTYVRRFFMSLKDEVEESELRFM